MAKRKHISLKTKLASALSCLLSQEERDRIRKFPYTADEVISFFEWDHTILHAHSGSDDWWNLTPMHKAQHREKSRKDTGIVAKTKRLSKAQAEHKRFMDNANKTSKALDRWADEKRAEDKERTTTLYRWPKRKIQNRGFTKAHRPMRGKR